MTDSLCLLQISCWVVHRITGVTDRDVHVRVRDSDAPAPPSPRTAGPRAVTGAGGTSRGCTRRHSTTPNAICYNGVESIV